jgi:chemotaxis protein methyltransferase CheR
MSGAACVEFLKWALPQLGLRWEGFRKVRRQVCRQLGKRLQELGLPHPTAYRQHLATHPEEWSILDSFCRIPVSRFFRDQIVFDALAAEVFPYLAHAALHRGTALLRCWSIGCASGEEPYSLSILWQTALCEQFPTVALRVTATDAAAHLIERALSANYQYSSLRELPPDLLPVAFTRDGDGFVVREEFRHCVEFQLQDIRETVSVGPFDLVMCRNLVFTYFQEALQQRTLERILTTLRPGGAFVIGLNEDRPAGHGLEDWAGELGIFRRPVHTTVTSGTPTRGLGGSGSITSASSPWN